ncbi:MAG: carbon-nitrogen hydrolase family protein [Rhodospirillales bacterium]|nr:carbon-nitrogen hydrolase family protein [Rhodospirillales bacterium]
MTFKIAVIQPMSHRPPSDEGNIADAVKHIETAAGQGADFVCFPESYPGPWRMPATFDPIPVLCEAAARHKVHVVFGALEPIDEGKQTAHNLVVMAYPDGREAARYRRTHPAGPWIYTGGKYWEFQYVAGSEFPVFATEHGTIGLAMCSEVYMPEVTRALALRGAELIFMPAGMDKNRLWASWRNLIWSRSIENLAVVVTTQNLFSAEDRGLAMVAAPEEILFESTKAGSYLIDVGLERIRDLRAQTDQVGSTKKNGAKAGLLSQWQRPDLYDRFYPRKPREAAE